MWYLVEQLFWLLLIAFIVGQIGRAPSELTEVLCGISSNSFSGCC